MGRNMGFCWDIYVEKYITKIYGIFMKLISRALSRAHKIVFELTLHIDVFIKIENLEFQKYFLIEQFTAEYNRKI